MNDQRWYYFLSLERDFIRTLEYVAFGAKNALTFSDAYAKLLLLIGSEVDIVAKLACQKARPGSSPKKIYQYGDILTAGYPGLHTITIEASRCSTSSQPWITWGTRDAKHGRVQSPTWWNAYNHVKHARDEHYGDANQRNTFDALCGLLALLHYCYDPGRMPQPYPELLEYGFPSYRITESGKLPPGTYATLEEFGL